VRSVGCAAAMSLQQVPVRLPPPLGSPCFGRYRALDGATAFEIELDRRVMGRSRQTPRSRVPRSATRVAATARSGVRDEDMQFKQLTARGAETRRRLIVAARRVFEEIGFVEARVEDIARTAGAANGSFYTYFDSKQAVLDAVALEVFEELESAILLTEHLGPRAAFETINKQYFDTWIRNRKMLMTLYQVSGFLPHFFSRLSESHRRHAKRIAARLRHLQERGIIDSDVDPDHAAVALGAMVEQSLRWWVGQGEPFDPDIALSTLNTLWTRAIGLRGDS
jgi:AcrR family transcriptional regulator